MLLDLLIFTLGNRLTVGNQRVSFAVAYGAKYLGLFSSRSLRTREKYVSFAQFVYFLSKKTLNCEFYHSKIEK